MMVMMVMMMMMMVMMVMMFMMVMMMMLVSACSRHALSMYACRCVFFVFVFFVVCDEFDTGFIGPLMDGFS